jgi:chemotaxis regulatin CheY-phosphate phosphatase CheZ
MTETKALSPLNEDDYGAIADAVMETARGRWFLGEYAKRNRTADTDLLLTAINRLESSVGGERTHPQIEQVRFDLVEMAKTIAQLKIEVSSSDDQSQFMQATEALDAVVKTTETATSSILESAEQIQEMAWTLRESGADIAVCDALDRRAADIYTACTFQDLTAQRTQKVVRTLRFLEGRINALVDAWSSDKPMPAAMAHPMASSGNWLISHDANPREDTDIESLSQDDIDVVIINHADDPSDLWLDHDKKLVPASSNARDESRIDDTDIAFVELPYPGAEHLDPVSLDIPVAYLDDIEIAEVATPIATHQSLIDIDAMPTTAKLSVFG